MITQLQNFYDCLGDALDVIVVLFRSLNIRFAGVKIDVDFLVGAAIVAAIYHHILGSELQTQEEFDLFSYHDDEEY